MPITTLRVHCHILHTDYISSLPSIFNELLPALESFWKMGEMICWIRRFRLLHDAQKWNSFTILCRTSSVISARPKEALIVCHLPHTTALLKKNLLGNCLSPSDFYHGSWSALKDVNFGLKNKCDIEFYGSYPSFILTSRQMVYYAISLTQVFAPSK